MYFRIGVGQNYYGSVANLAENRLNHYLCNMLVKSKKVAWIYELNIFEIKYMYVLLILTNSVYMEWVIMSKRLHFSFFFVLQGYEGYNVNI